MVRKTLGHVYRIILTWKWSFLMVFVLFTLSSIFETMIPLILRNIVNLVEQEQYSEVFPQFSLVIFVELGFMLTIGLGNQLSDSVVFKAAQKLRLKIFKHLHDLDYDFHTNKSSGSLISLFKRGESGFWSFYLHLNVFNLRIFLRFIMMILVLGFVYPKLIWVAVVVIILNTLFMFYSLRNNIRQRKYLNKIDW